MSADERCQSVLTEMQRAGLDALIAVSGDVYAFQKPNAVMLLSGFRAIGDSFVVLHGSGESTLGVSPAWDAERAAASSRTTRVEASDDICTSLAATVARLALPRSRLGIVGSDTLAFATALQLGRVLGDGARRFDSEFAAVTRRKSAIEVANAVRATRIAEQGYELLLRRAKPGVREIELAEEINSAMTALGADDNFLMLSASRHNRAVRPPGNHALERGDIILCEISPSFNGQFSQICRTAMVGPAPDAFAAKYELLRESFHNGMRAAVPGASVADLVGKVNANLIEAGYGEFCVPPHMRARGHGLGFGSIDPGDLSSGSQAVIDCDMVFVIHPNQYMPETGYMMCGDPVLVLKEGTRNLAERPATFDQIELQ